VRLPLAAVPVRASGGASGGASGASAPAPSPTATPTPSPSPVENPDVALLNSIFDQIDWWQFGGAVLVLIAGWIASGLAKRLVERLLSRASGVTPGMIELTARLTRYGVILLSVGVAFALLGANMQPVLSMALIVGIVLALMLRGVAGDFAAGMLLQSRRTVRTGDRIEVKGPGGLLTGTVKVVNARAVIMLTLDGRTAHIPNSDLVEGILVNHSTHGSRRNEVRVRVERRGQEDIDELLAALATAVQRINGVHARPAAEAVPLSITPTRITATVRFWHHPAHRVAVTAVVVRTLAHELESSGAQATVTSLDEFGPIVPADQI
jgi:small conductance mechanosensitive channel